MTVKSSIISEIPEGLCRFLPIVFIFTVWMLWRPGAVFLVPGILFTCIPERDDTKLDLLTAATCCVGISIAYWTVIFWWLRYLPVPLSQVFAVSFWITAGLLAWLGSRRRSLPLTCSRADLWTMSVFILFAVLRFRVMGQVIVPAGADMSMHTYIAALISLADGIPGSYRPLLPLDVFSTFPVGFHVLTAIVAQAGNVAPHVAGLIVTCLTYSFLPLSIFCLIRLWAGRVPAIASSVLVSFIFRDPSSFVAWGGNPTTMAIAMVPLFLYFLAAEKRLSAKKRIIGAAFSLAAVFLIHTIIFMQTFYLLLFTVPLYAWLSGQVGWRSVSGAMAVLLLFLLLCSPYLVSLDPGIVSPATVNWIKGWVRNTGHAWHGDVGDFWWTVPSYIFQRLGRRYLAVIIVFIIAGWCSGGMLAKNRAVVVSSVVFVLSAVLIILNCRYWVLPFSYAIYPERTVAMLIIPIAVLLSLSVEHLASVGTRKFRLFEYFPVLFVVVVVFMAVSKYNFKYFEAPLIRESSVTPDDLAALKWLRDNSGENDVVLNNYGDAGVWIPAIALRSAVNAHVNVAYLDKMKPLPDPKYAFVGSKCVYMPCSITAGSLGEDPDFKEVFHSGDTFIYERKER